MIDKNKRDFRVVEAPIHNNSTDEEIVAFLNEARGTSNSVIEPITLTSDSDAIKESLRKLEDNFYESVGVKLEPRFVKDKDSDCNTILKIFSVDLVRTDTTKERSAKEEEDFDYFLDNEIICDEKYCPFFQKHMSSPSNPNCEGRYCEEAWDNYCDINNREYER